LLTNDIDTLEEVVGFCPDALRAIELSPFGELPQLIAKVNNAIHQATLADIPEGYPSDPEFFAAVKEGDLNLCTWLFDREQANPSSVDPKTGLSPLIVATKAGDTDMVQLLLQKRVDVDARCEMDGFTALHWAAHARSARVMTLLLNGGANPRIRDKKGQDALMKLLRRDFKAPAVGCAWSWVMHPHLRLPGAELAGSGVMELEDAKVAAEATPDCVGISFRSAGIGHQPQGKVNILLHGAGSKSRYVKQRAPPRASEQEQEETSRDPQPTAALGKAACIPGSFGKSSKKPDNTHLFKGKSLQQTHHAAMEAEEEEVVEEETIEDHESNWTSCLRVATDPAHDVIALLAAGADPCAEDNGGLTSLHHHLLSAPSRGSLAVVSCLLRAQADVNARDRTARSTTPFLLAVSSKRTDLVRLMLADAWPTANVDDRTCDGVCALAIAEERGALDVMELLKGAGAQVWSDADVNFGSGEHSSFFFDTRRPIGLDA
jgi:ankyrin repeat protein